MTTKKIKITLQEVFNKVWERAKVKSRSMNTSGSMCTYRNSDSSQNHCFVGVCIPDELYSPFMEGKGFAVNEAIKKLFPKRLHNPLIDLQDIHDRTSHGPANWPAKLTKFAKKHRLKVPA